MTQIVEFVTDDGHVLSFETSAAAGDPGEDDGAYAPASSGDGPLRRRFEDAFDDLRVLARGLTAKLDAPDVRPDKIEVNVGVKMGGKTGIIFASAEGEATLSVKLTWERKSGA